VWGVKAATAVQYLYLVLGPRPRAMLKFARRGLRAARPGHFRGQGSTPAPSLARYFSAVPDDSEYGVGKRYEDMVIGVPKETFPLERRVSQTPESVEKLVKAGFQVQVESGAGAASTFSDEMYKAVGAEIVGKDMAWKADIVTHIRPPSGECARR
jgi:hypothetical protein